jgi:hypothetical protein
MADKNQRKPFREPDLRVYGDIAEVTRAVGMTGALDGMATGNTKTTAN